MADYKIKNGTILSENGLPYAPRWFCDGRVTFEADNDGITDIDYFNRLGGHYKIFHKRFWGGMRFFVRDENGFCKIRPKKCEILPFGYRSVSEKGEFSLYTFDDAIFVNFKPNCKNARFYIEFYDDYLFCPDKGRHCDVRYAGAAERIWDEPHNQDGKVFLSFSENETVKCGVTFSSDSSLELNFTPRNRKYIITPSENEEYTVAIAFSEGDVRHFPNYKEGLEAQTARYRAVSQKAPVLISKHRALNDFFGLAPMYHESLKARDISGAIRAQSTHYWVWGWDSMTSNDCCVYWGDRDFLGDMLECMMKYSDSETGIPHAFGRNMSSGGAAAAPAQGMYITLLDLYRLAGGDYKKYYDFAKVIFQTICKTEVRNTGLCRGTSLYPDFRNLIKETGNDISCFNNTVSYCAIRSMQALASAYGDKETGKIAEEFAVRMKKGFEDIVFNKKYGFFDSSVDADTYERRNVLSNNAVKWENDYCAELVLNRGRECLDYYEKKLVCNAGIRPLAEDSECYNLDANQLSCWWPVMSEFYTRLINKYNKPELVTQYIGWIEYWTERLMCPEGISCYDDTAEVAFDNWNCLSGIWHAYSIRGFYNAVVHCFIGVDFDENGINFYPYSGEEAELLGLHFGEKEFDLHICGSGAVIKSVILNGKNIGAVNRIPFESLKQHNDITVNRGEA